MNIHWRDWCWKWSFNTLGTWCDELSHWKKLCCWERLRAGGKGGDRGWDGWMASQTRHEFQQIPGDSRGQRSLACYSPWGCKESDTTEWLNKSVSNYINTLKLIWPIPFCFLTKVWLRRKLKTTHAAHTLGRTALGFPGAPHTARVSAAVVSGSAPSPDHTGNHLRAEHGPLF